MNPFAFSLTTSEQVLLLIVIVPWLTLFTYWYFVGNPFGDSRDSKLENTNTNVPIRPSEVSIILANLAMFNFPKAYSARFSVFGSPETDAAAELAICVSVHDLDSDAKILDFLHDLWGYATRALDHGDYKMELESSLQQLEIELAQLVMAMRGPSVHTTAKSKYTDMELAYFKQLGLSPNQSK